MHPRRTIHIPNSRLTEGETYPFLLLKLVSLGPDDTCFVLRDPLGYKILMPEKYYTRYGFETGQTIQCRVDKVNCSGRMFLEPQHPYYIEGNTYHFDIINNGQRNNLLGHQEHFFLVKDLLGHEWTVNYSDENLAIERPLSIPCVVKRIKKGRLYLAVEGDRMADPRLVPGMSMPFSVMGVSRDTDSGMACFILEDKFGSRHKLIKRFYAHYGIRLNDSIRCRIIKMAADGSYVLEPEHPYYEIDKQYDFSVIGIDELVFSDGFRQKVLVLKDCFGEEAKVFIEDQLADHISQNALVTARVTEIYKSRLTLLLPEQEQEQEQEQ